MNKLEKIKDSLRELPSLEKELTNLSEKIEDTEQRVEQLQNKYKKLVNKLDKLENKKISKFILTKFGKYENVNEKLIMKKIDSKELYEESNIHLLSLIKKRENLTSKISELKIIKQEYKEELGKKKRQIVKDTTEIGLNYEKIVKEKEELLNRIEKLEKIIKMASYAKQTSYSIKRSLKSARNWSTFDIFSKKSFLKDIIKYERIDETTENIEILITQLNSLENYISDTKDFFDETKFDVNFKDISRSTRLIDTFFDNIFTDIHVKDKIVDNYEEITNIIYKLYNLQNRTKEALDNTKVLINILKDKEEDLLVSYGG
ncbi:MAG: hypothetical protein FWF57_07950 [Defluviitaleaceae bacterium]|nr:hypothetical protein [Defluviitaleaceae bacterium]